MVKKETQLSAEFNRACLSQVGTRFLNYFSETKVYSKAARCDNGTYGQSEPLFRIVLKFCKYPKNNVSKTDDLITQMKEACHITSFILIIVKVTNLN